MDSRGIHGLQALLEQLAREESRRFRRRRPDPVDLVQEAWVRILDHGISPSAPAGALRLLIRNVAWQTWREACRVLAAGDLSWLDRTLTSRRPCAGPWSLRPVPFDRWQLPPTQQEVVRRLLGGKSIREIASELGINPRSVRSRAEAARRRITGEAGAASMRIGARRALPNDLTSFSDRWARAHELDCRGASYAAIAREFGVRKDTARSLIRRVRRALGAGKEAGSRRLEVLGSSGDPPRS